MIGCPVLPGHQATAPATTRPVADKFHEAQRLHTLMGKSDAPTGPGNTWAECFERVSMRSIWKIPTRRGSKRACAAVRPSFAARITCHTAGNALRHRELGSLEGLQRQ